MMDTIGTRWYGNTTKDGIRASIYFGSRSSDDGKVTVYGYHAELLHDGGVALIPKKLGFYRTKAEAILRLKNEYPEISFE